MIDINTIKRLNCSMCKGNLIDKLTTFMVDIGGRIIIVKNVPSQVCGQCGEASYRDDIARQLEGIVNSLNSSITEIAVVNFPDKAA